MRKHRYAHTFSGLTASAADFACIHRSDGSFSGWISEISELRSGRCSGIASLANLSVNASDGVKMGGCFFLFVFLQFAEPT